jgi:K+-transporting ATPase KdpF subunit
MNAVEFVALAISIGLFAYLIAALFKPEWFS